MNITPIKTHNAITKAFPNVKSNDHPITPCTLPSSDELAISSPFSKLVATKSTS